jgi:hypothetical protein
MKNLRVARVEDFSFAEEREAEDHHRHHHSQGSASPDGDGIGEAAAPAADEEEPRAVAFDSFRNQLVFAPSSSSGNLSCISLISRKVIFTPLPCVI